jgi:hypothetical protein
MIQPVEFPPLSLQAGRAASLIQEGLVRSGLQVLPSFDLQAARAGQEGSSCPQHGTAPCECQMIVLLVYGSSGYPATLVLYSQDEMTCLNLLDGYPQQYEPGLTDLIQRAILETTLFA